MAVTFAGFDLCDLCLWGNLNQSLQNYHCILKAFTARSTGGYSRHHAKLQLVTQFMSMWNVLLYFRTKFRTAILISGKGIYSTELLLELGRNVEVDVRWCEHIDAVYITARYRQFRIIVKSAYYLCHVRPPILPSFFLSTCLSICPPVYPSACIGAVHTGRIYVKFDVGCFHNNLPRRTKFDWNRTEISETCMETKVPFMVGGEIQWL